MKTLLLIVASAALSSCFTHRVICVDGERRTCICPAHPQSHHIVYAFEEMVKCDGYFVIAQSNRYEYYMKLEPDAVEGADGLIDIRSLEERLSRALSGDFSVGSISVFKGIYKTRDIEKVFTNHDCYIKIISDVSNRNQTTMLVVRKNH